jgi:spermidine synthase
MNMRDAIGAAWIVEAPSSFEFTARSVERVLTHTRTAFQELYVISTRDLGKALVLDGKWQSCVADEFIYHEALVQPALVLHGSPERVLILGGAEGATAREVARWPGVRTIVMVDIDGAVVDACKTHLVEMHRNVFDDPRMTVVINDGYEFLANDHRDWDVVILDLCDPVEDGPSLQLFTVECFATIARALKPGGVVAVQAGPALGRGFAAVVRTMKSMFRTVLPYSITVPSYPGPWAFILATEAPLSLGDEGHVAKMLEPIRDELRCLDAAVLRAMFVLPRHIRSALELEGELSTQKSPITFF